MPPHWSRRRTLRVGGALGIFGVAGCLGSPETDSRVIDEPLSATAAQQFSAPGCRCCERYASYLRGNMRGDLSETVPDDVDEIKREYGIPAELRACHTLILDGYVVEGHVPAEVIAKLLDEQPAIDGIALPGMPRGSPGMSGERDGPFTIYVVGGDRSGKTFEKV